MLRRIRESPDAYRESQRRRGKDPESIDRILHDYENWCNFKFRLDELNKVQNTITRSFRKAPADPYDIEMTRENVPDVLEASFEVSQLNRDQLKKFGAIVKEDHQSVSSRVAALDQSLRDQLRFIGNIVHDSVPISTNEDDSETVTEWGEKMPHTDKTLPHHEICRRLKLADFETGTEIAGNRGYFLTGYGALLSRALVSYAIDFGMKNGYALTSTPLWMEKRSIESVCQLSDFEETLYQTDEGHYMIATSEQPLTAKRCNTQVRLKELPIREMGVSNCFRKETGRHGTDTNGLFRVHQFEKVEQFCITTADKSTEELSRMVDVTERFVQSLGLPYRVRRMASGDLNLATSVKYDLEAYFPSTENYRELASCSNCTDYFPVKIGCSIENKGGHPHMLNATLCANTRTLCCLLENWQQDDGSVVIPEVLRKYGLPEKLTLPE